MTVQIIVSLGGGGGSDFFAEFLDTVAVDASVPAIWPMITETYYDAATDISVGTLTVDVGTPAARGALILPTLDGWWNGADYSGSGAFLNQGTQGSALDLTVTGPTFSSGVFSFDGVDDYMRIVDGTNLLEILSSESYTLGLVMTPVTSISGHYISKNVGEAATLGYQLRSSTSAIFTWFNDSVGGISSLMGSNMVVGTKNMLAGVLNRQAPKLINSYRSAAGTMTTGVNGTVGGTQFFSAANAFDFTIGCRSDLTSFAKMDVNGIFFSKRALSAIDLGAIAAYYGV